MKKGMNKGMNKRFGFDDIQTLKFDCLILGAGGAGLNAALQLSQAHLNVAVVSKVFPTRSHTVAAQGGVNAALGNMRDDKWLWHMFDTVKGADYLGDQDAIEFMCKEAAATVYELEHTGVPFSRLPNGKIYQRPFGGQSYNFGAEQASRTCAAADRTGHAILHSLYQQNLRIKTHFFDEYFAIDLIKNESGVFLGALVMEIASGKLVLIEAKTTLIATGGCGQVYSTTTNAHINTGDGMAMALRAGIPLQDMEFFQFHPTGIAGKGMLITEAVRGEGGFLINKDGERFMERYAPIAKDLASRDVVARAIVTEINEGRGCGPRADHVKLRVDHLGVSVVAKLLPAIREISKIFCGVDPAHESIPVFPTAHYIMGGIPTDLMGRVIKPAQSLENSSQAYEDNIVPGLYAAGECACASVHGANRLGGNSLLDILVFGRAAAKDMQAYIHEHSEHLEMKRAYLEPVLAKLNHWQLEPKSDGCSLSVKALRKEFQKLMEVHAGVFRTQELMEQGIENIKEIRGKLKDARLSDHSLIFNTNRILALELENMIDIGLSIAYSALHRTESRGAHSRPDYPKRDDANWLRHSLYFQEHDHIAYKPIRDKPLTVDTFEPMERVY